MVVAPPRVQALVATRPLLAAVLWASLGSCSPRTTDQAVNLAESTARGLGRLEVQVRCQPEGTASAGSSRGGVPLGGELSGDLLRRIAILFVSPLPVTSSPPQRGPLPTITWGLSVSAVYLWGESKTLGVVDHRVLWAVKLASVQGGVSLQPAA